MGVWALVAQQLTNITIDTVILWFTVRWRPIIAFSFIRVKSLFSFGWKILFADLLNELFNHLRTIIIGKVYSANDLAYFTKGKEYPNTIVSSINGSFNSVFFSAISKVQDNPNEVRLIMKRSLKTCSFVLCPMMLGLAAISESFVSFFLTEKWISCVPYLQIFCIAYFISPLLSINLQAVKALGRSDITIRQELIKKILGTLILVISMFFGVFWIAIGSLISQLVYFAVNAYPNRQLVNYGPLQQVSDVLQNLASSIVMAIIVLLLGKIEMNKGLILLIQVIVGFVIYISISYLTKNESMRYIKYFVLERIKPK